ncbi:DUF6082 family protein [Cerasicoccus fimbriatus]|uniref:DUF6082 family protein n=1 Tax=Cerasicoccus fimbriatus TaxID=3014554 RepID=UPI0022B2FD2E|nr:DUF6082 family protein [Cerasicoccus sp. TK19100]
MTLDWLASNLEGVAATLGFPLILWQLWRNHRQRQFEAGMNIYAVNRELVQMAMHDPELMKVLTGESSADMPKERHYAQLWLNHMEIIHHGGRKGFLSRSSWQSLQQDIRESLNRPNIRRHWDEKADYYPAEFRNFINTDKP